MHNLANGTIHGGGFGIVAGANADFDVTNFGTISGGFKGIFLQGLNINTVTNAGTISGTAASVEFFGTGTNVLTLQTGSNLIGTAFGSTQSADNQLILQGRCTADNNFQNFNSLTLKQGGHWTLNGSNTVGTTTLESNTELMVGDGNQNNVFLGGGVTVGNASALSGLGTVDGNVTVMTGGTLKPGNPTGTLTGKRQKCQFFGRLDALCYGHADGGQPTLCGWQSNGGPHRQRVRAGCRHTYNFCSFD